MTDAKISERLRSASRKVQALREWVTLTGATKTTLHRLVETSEQAADVITALQSERTNLIDTKRQQLAAKDEEIQRWKDTALEEARAFEDQKAVNADLRERLLAAEKTLEPFADVGELFEIETEGFADADELPLLASDEGTQLHSLKFGWFRLARTTLNQIRGAK